MFALTQVQNKYVLLQQQKIKTINGLEGFLRGDNIISTQNQHPTWQNLHAESTKAS